MGVATCTSYLPTLEPSALLDYNYITVVLAARKYVVKTVLILCHKIARNQLIIY